MTTTRITRHTLTALSAVLLAGGLTGCGFGSDDIGDVDMSSLSDAVGQAVEDHGIDRPDNVSCSGALSISSGAQSYCDLTYDDQRNLIAEVSVHRVGPDGIGFDMDIVDEDGNEVDEIEDAGQQG